MVLMVFANDFEILIPLVGICTEIEKFHSFNLWRLQKLLQFSNFVNLNKKNPQSIQYDGRDGICCEISKFTCFDSS